MTVVEKNVSKNKQISIMIDKLMERANNSLAKMKLIEQEEIDRIVKKMALAGLDQHMTLAKLAIEETGRGVYENKIIKNMFATEYIYHNIKYNKTVGVISESKQERSEEHTSELQSRGHLVCRLLLENQKMT